MSVDIAGAEQQLIAASIEIGSIAESAGWASDALAAMIETSGRSVDDLTVGELRAMRAAQVRRHREICG